MATHEFNFEILARELGIKGTRSGRQLIARCPMHQDRRPSFSLNIDSGLWTCFSSCGSGQFSKLVQGVLGCKIQEAHDWMLTSAELMPVLNPEKLPPEEPDLRWMAQWERCNRDVLPQWWFDRGLDWDVANTWNIRYDQDFAQLLIPFYVNHKLEGIIRRNFKSGPKYQNSPGLPRSIHLFGWGFTPQTAGPLILVVEGPLDCIRGKQLSDLPVVALLGLQLSQHHIRTLQYFSEICLGFDNDPDKAGDNAYEKVRNQLLQSGRLPSQVTRLALPPHRKDVGELSTAEEFQQALAERK